MDVDGDGTPEDSDITGITNVSNSQMEHGNA